MPRGLHKQLARLAHREGVSLNALLAAEVARYIGAREAAEQVERDR